MGTILSGAVAELFGGLENLGSAARDKRSLAYLLFELANLKNFDQVRERLDSLKDRRKRVIGYPGIKDKPAQSVLDPGRVAETITAIVKTLLDEQNGPKEISTRKSQFKAFTWSLPGPPENRPLLFLVFRHHLKQKAEHLIAQAGD